MHTQDIAAVDISRIDQELVKQNVTEQVLAKLRQDYAHLDKEITSKDEYDVVHRAQVACKDVRMLAVSICKKGREQALAEQRAWIAKEKEVVGQIEEVEDPLKRRKEEWNSVEERRMQEAAAAFARKMQARKERLFEVGFAFDGKKYVLDNEAGGEWSLTEEEVTGPGVDDMQLGEWLSTVERELRVNCELKAAAEAKAKEAAELVERERAELERRTQDLLKKEAELAGRILLDRLNQLQAAGSVEYPDSSVGFGADTFSKGDITAMDETTFAAFVTTVRTNAEAYTAEQVKVRRVAEEARVAREVKLQQEAADRAVAEEQARVKREAEEKQRQEARAKAERAEREAKMSDAEKLKAYHAALLAVRMPEMKSKAGSAHLARFVETLGTLLAKK